MGNYLTAPLRRAIEHETRIFLLNLNFKNRFNRYLKICLN